MNEIKERGIPFKGPMVRAILEGRKTQTRRVIKPQPIAARCCVVTSKGAALFFKGTTPESPSCDGAIPNSPYGVPGERLWVRETWRDKHPYDETGELGPCFAAEWTPEEFELIGGKTWGWKPSIFMPRSASRINLVVTSLRVERLKQITLQDVEAEGTPVGIAQSQWRDGYARFQDFKVLWNGINEKRGFGWEANPWVWVYGFRRLEADARGTSP